MDIGSSINSLNQLFPNGQVTGKADASTLVKNLTNVAQEGIEFGDSLSNALSRVNQGQGERLSGMSAEAKNLKLGYNDSIQSLGSRFLETANNSIQKAQLENARVVVGESDNIHQSILQMHESNAYLNLTIAVGNKLQEFYKTMMQIQA